MLILRIEEKEHTYYHRVLISEDDWAGMSDLLLGLRRKKDREM
jgi:hypothetical protein